MNARTTRKYRILFPLILGLVVVLLSASVGISGNIAYAQSPEPPAANPYFTQVTSTLPNGTVLVDSIISGPPVPPPGYEAEKDVLSDGTTPQLAVPRYTWVFGCSAVSGAMIAGYYDRHGFPNMYKGPKNGGVMPMTPVWGNWSDGFQTYPRNPLIASQKGTDGRTTKGSIDDYWIKYGSTAPDPYLPPAPTWAQHAWGTAIGDYMKTSQSKYGNSDGSTGFWGYSDATKLTCKDLHDAGPSYYNTDGTYGRMLFYKARGYKVNLTTGCYAQATSNKAAGGFSLANYKAQINAGRPVMINLAGHTIVGVGYGSGSTIIIHNTWDTTDVHTMTWGGSYSGMQMLSVSIVIPTH